MTETTEFYDVECITATAKALLVDGIGDEHTWVPKSVVQDDSEVYDVGHKGTLVVALWWAEERNLI